jgi:hypothetical protein
LLFVRLDSLLGLSELLLDVSRSLLDPSINEHVSSAILRHRVVAMHRLFRQGSGL